MADGIERRMALALGGAAIAAGTLAGTARADRPASAAGVLLFDPTSPEARALAQDARGQRLVAMAGDPVRLWRDALAGHRRPVRGLTRWSDYLVLRGLAEEQGLRLAKEARIETASGPMIVDWSMA